MRKTPESEVFLLLLFLVCLLSLFVSAFLIHTYTYRILRDDRSNSNDVQRIRQNTSINHWTGVWSRKPDNRENPSIICHLYKPHSEGMKKQIAWEKTKINCETTWTTYEWYTILNEIGKYRTSLLLWEIVFGLDTKG